MKASKMLISTLKETPSEASIPSHVLLLRAGMMRKIVSGVYNYLPLGLRTLRKIENIVREEMDKSGALEILASAVQPKELWVESGRWFKYGPELFRFKDRHDRDFCLGPTHEEIFTDLARNEIKSKKALPMNIYQIQTKYRDEFRPRFGLMRGREFIMKDAYSFDVDEIGLDESYKNMYKTYERIFTRLGLNYQIVLADTGAIGGSNSHQFMALSDVGESSIIYCPDCNYAADEEKAETKIDEYKSLELELEIEEISTPKMKTIEEVSSFLGVNPKDVCKSVLYKNLTDNSLVLVLVRGDREVNNIKVVNALGIAEFELVPAEEKEIVEIGSIPGFIGPVGLNIKILVDNEVAIMKNMVTGSNKKDIHLKNVNYGRDFKGEVNFFRQADEGDFCINCGRPVKKERGIEVGQIFKLGTKYSASMNCLFQDEDGKNYPMVMGCYGIGITRTMASIIEQHHDEYGISWPVNVAPYEVVIIPVNYQDEIMKKVSDEIYEELINQVEVVLDDRNAKVGFKFKDWELIGIPYQIVVGKRAPEGIVELKNRETLVKEELPIKEAINKVIKEIKLNK